MLKPNKVQLKLLKYFVLDHDAHLIKLFNLGVAVSMFFKYFLSYE